MLKRFTTRVGKEYDEWKGAVKAVQREVEGGKGLHQLETTRRNILRAAENVSLREEASRQGKGTESN